MSRIGKLPIKIPKNVDIIFHNSDLKITGQFGTLQNKIPELLTIEQIDNNLIVNLKNKTRSSRALHGLYRTLINNMVIGVSEQFQVKMILKGVGYRAIVKNNLLILNLGYSHPIELIIPNGIDVEVVQNININLKGCNKEQLGLFGSKIRSWRIPEPYKGKGILYEGETIIRKAGKSGKK
jgi:large subunit ribosomal protein L6